MEQFRVLSPGKFDHRALSSPINLTNQSAPASDKLKMKYILSRNRDQIEAGFHPPLGKNFLVSCQDIYVLNHSLDRPFTRWARPTHSTNHRANGPRPELPLKFRVNGNEANLLNERLQFGSAGSLTSVSGVMPPANHQMRLFNKRKIATSVHFQFQQNKDLNSYAYFIPRNPAKLSTHHRQQSGPYHLRIYLTRALLETPCRLLVIIPFASGQVFRRQIGNF